jgi:hypothetical protein
MGLAAMIAVLFPMNLITIAKVINITALSNHSGCSV